jgi:hypothetical protein
MSPLPENPALDAAAGAISVELDQLSQRAGEMTSKTSEGVMRDLIAVIARCASLKNNFVSVEALHRAVELETRAKWILDRCYLRLGKKR